MEPIRFAAKTAAGVGIGDEAEIEITAVGRH
jgi:hypothetical protein